MIYSHGYIENERQALAEAVARSPLDIDDLTALLGLNAYLDQEYGDEMTDHIIRNASGTMPLAYDYAGELNVPEDIEIIE